MSETRRITVDPILTPALAEQYARLVVAGLVREYPNQPGFRLGGDVDLRPPRDVHPAFYGCYDWHSAVHGHWLLIRLLRTGLLACLTADEVRSLLHRHLTPANLAVERAYLDQPGCASFEWPYGWAWLVALEAEAKRWDETLAAALTPLADHLAGQVPQLLSRMRHPQRSGQHGDTAFALVLMLESGREDLVEPVHSTARRFFERDRDYAWEFEAGPYDFTSSGLNEVELMGRVLDGRESEGWLRGFWPGLWDGDFGALATPAVCPDPADGKLAHLIGLNLDRARGLRRLLGHVGTDHPAAGRIGELAEIHRKEGLAEVCSGHYAGDHWLATFAVRLLTQEAGGV